MSKKINVGPVSLVCLILAVLVASAAMWGGLEVFLPTGSATYAKASPGLPSTEGTLLALDSQKGTVALISLTSGATSGTILIGKGHRSLVVAPIGYRAISCQSGPPQAEGDSLTLINIPQRKISWRMPLGAYRGLHDPVWLDDRHVAVASHRPPAILVVDTVEQRVEQTLTRGSREGETFTLSRKGQTVYTASSGAKGLTVLDLRQKMATVAPSIPPSDSIAIAPDGETLWLSDSRSGTVATVDTATLGLRKTFPSHGSPLSIAVTRDSEHALVSHPGSGEIAFLSSWSEKEVKRLRVARPPSRPGARSRSSSIVVHPYSDYAYASFAASGGIAVLNLQNQTLAGSLECAKGVDSLAYTPFEALPGM